MTRSTLTQRLRAPRVVWSLYALAAGILAYGAGYAATRLSGTAAWGVAVAVVVTGAAGWWGAAVVQRLGPAPRRVRADSVRRDGSGPLERVRH